MEPFLNFFNLMVLFRELLSLTLMNKMRYQRESIDILLRMDLPCSRKLPYLSIIGMRLFPTLVLDNKSPLEVMFKTPPDYSFLRIFCCSCFPNIRPYNKNKLQFCTIECTFLGYSFNHKGYECLDPNGRIFIFRNVILMKYLFRLQKEFCCVALVLERILQLGL